MNKKFIQAVACLSFFALSLFSYQIANAVYSSSSSGYNTPIYASELNFTASSNSDGTVSMSWSSYAPAGFNYYKVVRSTTNPNPVYPDDSYIKYSSDPNFTSYTDKSTPNGDVYYRVCSIAKPNRYCSIVVKIASDGAATNVYDDKTPEPEKYDTIEPATINLTASMESDGVQLDWTVNGESPKGFKVAISTVNENPTYPVMSGDSYRYLSDSTKRSYKEMRLTAGKTYYFRVCQYLGGTCGSYSNSVSVTVPSDYSKSTESTEKETTTSVADKVKTVTVKATTGEFADSKAHRYNAAIDYLKKKSIVEGYNDGTFKPDYTINRAEFMKIIMGAKYASQVSDDSNCFSDVGDAWYSPYVCLAKEKGIVGGYGDGTFKPASSIKFVEAAKILAEVYGLDVESGGAWYEGYVRSLQKDNFIPSTVGSLDKSITRAEMAELIWRVKEQKKDQEATTLIQEPISTNGSDYSGWSTYSGDGFSFSHPGWYQGVKWGWDLLTDEKDFIDNINVPNYMAVDSYLSVYTVSGSDLNTTVWFAHPSVSSTELTINGTSALKRHYRAPRGTVVNGRTTGENENITIYTYRLNNGKVAVLQYFNAYGTENHNVETFYKIAESFMAN